LYETGSSSKQFYYSEVLFILKLKMWVSQQIFIITAGLSKLGHPPLDYSHELIYIAGWPTHLGY